MREKFQVHIRAHLGAPDREQVERVLVAAARQFGMMDMTITSRVPQTIRCFSELVGVPKRVGGNTIGAHVVGDLIIVDIWSGKEPSGHFSAIVEHITLELQRIFNERYHTPTPSEFIEPQHTLPIVQGSHDLALKQFHDENPET